MIEGTKKKRKRKINFSSPQSLTSILYNESFVNSKKFSSRLFQQRTLSSIWRDELHTVSRDGQIIERIRNQHNDRTKHYRK